MPPLKLLTVIIPLIFGELHVGVIVKFIGAYVVVVVVVVVVDVVVVEDAP